MHMHAAPVENLVKCKTLGLAPVPDQVQKLEGRLRQIISAKAYVCQVKKFIVEQFGKVLYNCYINRREPQMTTADFFADYSDTGYSEFVEYELSQIFQSTIPHDENFLLDVPY